MQERHDNDKIEPHNHNEYPLLYKEAELLTSVLGRFLECRKWNILFITWALGIFLIYMPAPSGLRPSGLGIYIRQIPLAHGITIIYQANPSCPCYTIICNSYNMGKRDLPDIYAQARGLQAQGRGHIYQENPECPCYN